MDKIKEITVFCYGNSAEISTWSNVPFFFTTTFENKGIIINRLNIAPNRIFNKLFNESFFRILNIFDKKNSYNYLRSFLFKIETNLKIRKAVKKFQQSDAFIFLNFDFNTKRYSLKPLILFGDWTYEHYIKYFLNKRPNFFEFQYIKRQSKNINEADIVFPLFPGMAENLTRTHTGNIKYLGNVINSLYESNEKEIITIKKENRKILFIGSPKYIKGANILLEAYNKIKSRYPDLTIDFIGLKTSDFNNLPEGVKCYGYLDKGNNEQRNIYYKLLKEARVFVNTTPKWSAFSASVEAMYFYTPIIVPQYEEFVKTFGENFEGGIYCDYNDDLSQKIELIFNTDSYEKICTNANELVKEFTWNSYIDKMIIEIKKL